MLSLVIVLASATCCPAEPVEATAYGRACLRIEARGMPWQSQPNPPLRAVEQARAQAGCGARWIQVVDHHGTPLVTNPFLPCPFADAEKNDAMLKQWVDEIHAAGMAAMSWFALSFCEAGWKEHPDWRQVSILPWPADPVTRTCCCCFNSPSGDRLIEYCNWAIERFKLDGIWFDGSAWTPIWQHPLPLTCRCAACRAKFKSQTGMEIPAKVDWQSPAFRAWLAWRYEQFGGYIGRLAGAIRAKHPHAAVVINHYHRPGVPWHSAIPLDRYAADIISGSEAFSPDSLDLTMRLCRAYGRSQAEVWRQFNTEAGPEASADFLLQHALICYSAGGNASFGGDPLDPKMNPTAALMSPIMKAIHPFVGGPSLPYAAIHVSQQTETFFFGPVEGRDWSPDPYFDALSAWTAALGEEHIPPDYLYDADFRPETLARYRVVLMPLSLALSDAQSAAAVEFARSGGTLLLGVGAGQLDERGWPRKVNRLGQALGFAFDGVPDADVAEAVNHMLHPAGGGRKINVSGRHAPLRLSAPEWQVLYRESAEPQGAAAVATRPFGKGRVVVVNVDSVLALGASLVEGGKTKLAVSDEAAATGRYSLKFVDDAVAPETYYPDLETRLPAFAAPAYCGGQLRCDLKLGKNAHVSVEVRSSRPPHTGPLAAIGPQQKILAGGQPLCDLPLDQWVHLEISWEFAAGAKPASYQVTAILPGNQRFKSPRLPTPEPRYDRTDWFVIFGAGSAPATFYVDNIELVRVKRDGTRQTVERMDFEDGPRSFSTPTGLARTMVQLLQRSAAPPIEVTAPDHVRVGLFRGSAGHVLVHLHDRHASRRDWQQPTGPAAKLRCDYPVRSAKLAVERQSLPVREKNGRWEIELPAVGLYRVVDVER